MRQWGVIAVAADNDRQVIWGRHLGVRQIDILPESLQGEDVVAGFEYSALPYTLGAGLAQRKTRINVDPEYILYVSPDRVELEGKLSYFIRGSKIHVLRLSMPDWEIDEAGPENLVAQDSIDHDENGLVTIPLQQPASGRLELRLRAYKMLRKSADSSIGIIARAASPFAQPGDSGGRAGRQRRACSAGRRDRRSHPPASRPAYETAATPARRPVLSQRRR